MDKTREVGGMGFFAALLALAASLLLSYRWTLETGMVAFCMFLAAGVCLWADGLETIPVDPPDDWGHPKGD